MAKEMNVRCNFLENNLTCVLLEHTMDILLKVRTRSGEHTFWEDVYTRTLKYRRWNNELRPFHSLKKKVANMFRKRNLLSDSSRSTSTQTIVNNFKQCKAEVMDNDSETDSNRNSVHSNWSELIPINNETSNAFTTNTEAKKSEAQTRKRAIKNIVLVPYKPKPKDLGSWKVKSPYTTSTIASPALNNQNQSNEEMVYVPHSPYYSPVHPPTFYGDT